MYRLSRVTCNMRSGLQKITFISNARPGVLKAGALRKAAHVWIWLNIKSDKGNLLKIHILLTLSAHVNSFSRRLNTIQPFALSSVISAKANDHDYENIRTKCAQYSPIHDSGVRFFMKRTKQKCSTDSFGILSFYRRIDYKRGIIQ